jgi:hypothetical protein
MNSKVSPSPTKGFREGSSKSSRARCLLAGGEPILSFDVQFFLEAIKFFDSLRGLAGKRFVKLFRRPLVLRVMTPSQEAVSWKVTEVRDQPNSGTNPRRGPVVNHL